ncbi:MAG: hypothetical protein KKB90_01600, partial [Actinobacteria bacterium]|nr:hypothetical protein [Actinomycetota bacterium]MBU4217640.1 hypothetical protein [Actinomycetota bacterium]MBU4359703.1 hypothetical protein [Actinomycetota bacterium]MBU4401126.1 hypothetical protein [Actinomycetota bacterium]MBU4442881.1 hypothetical protein [Actinomycetota bacterium]
MKKRFSFLVAVILAVTVLLPGVALGAPPLGGYVGSWEMSAGGGFGVGPVNATAGPLVEYKGDLYAAVANESGCQVWVKGAGGWTQVNGQPGFDNAENKGIARMATFDGKLYAGTANQATGCEVWEYDGNTWKQVGADGLGKASNIGVTAMEVFDEKLYVGVANFDMGSMKSDGGEIHSYDGLAWIAEMNGGFDDTRNMAVSSLATYGGTLYAGTTRVDIKTELIGFTQIKVTMTSLGCELRKLDGAKVAGDGFTDKRNAAVTAMEVFDGKLYIGTTNGDATATVEILTQEVSEYAYDTDGLYVYAYDGNVVSEEIGGGFDSPDEFSVNEMVTMDVTGSDMLLVGVGRVEGVGRLMAFDGSDWFPGALDGFGNTDNRAIAGIAAFGGKAYAGTGNDTTGCEVWFGTPPASRGELSRTWYLAEGCTNGGFETWVLVQNPGDEKTTAQLTFMTGAGEVAGPTLELLPNSRQSVDVGVTVPGEWDVSTKVTADHPVIAERSVYWND